MWICISHTYVLPLIPLKINIPDIINKWPYTAKPISHSALLNAKTGPGTTNDERGILTKDGKPVMDWPYTSPNIAKANGEPTLSLIP